MNTSHSISGLRTFLSDAGEFSALMRVATTELAQSIQELSAAKSALRALREPPAKAGARLIEPAGGNGASVAANNGAAEGLPNRPPQDLLCKWCEFPENSGAYLVLPESSSDPVIESYRNGSPANQGMLEFLSELTQPGDQVIDLGCHVGTFSVGAAAMARKVLSVDASPAHIDLMAKSRDINRFEHLRLCYSAVSTTEGVMRFIENGIYGSLDYSGASSEAIEVPSARLDTVVANNALDRVRFVKMDIEGAEYDALLSGAETIRRDQPVIWFESNGPTLRAAGQSVDAVRRLLEDFGYKTFRIEDGRFIYAPPGQIQPEAWVDMLALPASDRERFVDRIDWLWPPGELLAKCRFWAGLPHENTRLHLLDEIASHPADPAIAADLSALALELERKAP